MPYLGNYEGAPSVTPSNAGGDFIRDVATPNAFGVNVDEAKQGLARQGERTADRLQDFGDRLQDQYNQAATTDLENQFTLATSQRTAEFNQLQGKDALAAKPAYDQFITDTRDKLLSGAPNGAVARIAGQRLANISTSLLADSTRHQVAQTVQYGRDQQKAGIALSQDQAGQNVDDLQAFGQKLAETKYKTEQYHASYGRSADDPQTQLAVKQEESTAWKNRWASMTLQGKAEEAMLEYTAHRNNILDPGDTIHDAIYSGQTSQFIQAQSRRMTAGFGTAEGITNAIYGQESGFGKNSKTSVDNAHGVMQIIPETFQRYATAGENIDNRADNLAVGKRIVEDLYQRFNGDPARIAVGYFSGEGNVAPVGSKTPWKVDKTDGNGKHVSDYTAEVLARLGDATTRLATPTEITRMSEQARIEAEQKFPGDTKIGDQASNATRQRFNLAKQDITLAKTESIYKARDAVFAKTDADPTARPDRWDELMNDPTFKAQIDSLNSLPDGPREVAKLQGMVHRNILNVPDSPERTDRFQELQGIKADRPQDFRQMDLTDEDLTRQQMSELHQSQRKMNDFSTKNPNLNEAKKVLINDNFFIKAGMKPSTFKEPNPDYDKFMGQFNAQVAAWQARGVPPKDEEVKQFAAMLLTPMGQGFGAKPYYQQPIPADIRDDIVRQYQQKKNATPTEQEVTQLYNNWFYSKARGNQPAIRRELARRAAAQAGRPPPVEED
jgi:hypothetical protein